MLRWIGPWRAEFFVGVLDGPDRIAHNTLYNALRVTFAPVKGLEIGFARTQMLCGSGHSCNLLKSYLSLRNDNGEANNNNDQANIDLRYTNSVAGHPFEIYTQALNEDTNPLAHGFSSHLVGASVWVPVAANTARVTAEYTSSIATRDIFSFGNVGYGISYNNSRYPDGMRYRGRKPGFSLDSDSRLLTMQGSLSLTQKTAATPSACTAPMSRAHRPARRTSSRRPQLRSIMRRRVWWYRRTMRRSASAGEFRPISCARRGGLVGRLRSVRRFTSGSAQPTRNV